MDKIKQKYRGRVTRIGSNVYIKYGLFKVFKLAWFDCSSVNSIKQDMIDDLSTSLTYASVIIIGILLTLGVFLAPPHIIDYGLMYEYINHPYTWIPLLLIVLFYLSIYGISVWVTMVFFNPLKSFWQNYYLFVKKNKINALAEIAYECQK